MSTPPPGTPEPIAEPRFIPPAPRYVPEGQEGQEGQTVPAWQTAPAGQEIPLPEPPLSAPPTVRYPPAPSAETAPPMSAPYSPPPYPQYTYPPPAPVNPTYPAYPAYPGAWAYGTPGYPPAPVTPDATIGPQRVPWHWYDVLVASFIFILTAIATVVTSVAKGGLTTTPTTTTAPNVNHDALLIANLIGTAVIYGIVLLLIWWRSVQTYHVPWSALGVRKAPALAWILVVPIWFVMFVAAALVGQAVNLLFYGGKAQNPQIDAITGGGGFSWIALVTAILSASIIAPIVEELLFRGMLYGLLRSRWPSAVLAVLVDGALFAAAHGIGLILASIFVVGVTLCIVYEKTKSTLVTMTLHCLFNSFSVATVFITLATGGKL